jgi:hypothetical protein
MNRLGLRGTICSRDIWDPYRTEHCRLVPLSHKLCIYFRFVHLSLARLRLTRHSQALDVRTALGPHEYLEVSRTTYPHNPRTDRLPASSLSFPHSFPLLLVLFLRVPLPSPPNEMATYMGHIYYLGDDQSPAGPLQRFASMVASYSCVVAL